jgi:hypothetical protein
MEPVTKILISVSQTMNQNQTIMTPEQIQEVRGLAYHLWLQADRPCGKEMDFWLSAEKQYIQAATKKAADEITLKAVPVVRSVSKKSKPNTKRTQ